MSRPSPSRATASQDPQSFRDPAEKPRRGPRRPVRPVSQSSLRFRPDRAPRLRRAADRIAEGALRTANPAAALRLARDLRIRASQIECDGDYDARAQDLELIVTVLGCA